MDQAYILHTFTKHTIHVPFRWRGYDFGPLVAVEKYLLLLLPAPIVYV